MNYIHIQSLLLPNRMKFIVKILFVKRFGFKNEIKEHEIKRTHHMINSEIESIIKIFSIYLNTNSFLGTRRRSNLKSTL